MKSLSSFTVSWSRTVRKGELWCAFLALSLSLSIASPVFTDLITSGGNRIHLRDRTIESSTTTASYAELYLVLGGSFLVLFVLLSLLNGGLRQRIQPEETEQERSGILLLSEFSLFLFVLRLFVGDAIPEVLRTGLHYLSLLLILAMLAKAWVSTRMRPGSLWTVTLGYLNDDQLKLAGLFLPVPLMFALGLFLDGPLPAGSVPAFFVLYSALLFALVTIYVLLASLLARGSRLGLVLALQDMNGALILAGIPVILIPIALPVANELQNAWRGLDPRRMAMALVAALVVATGVLFFLQRHGRFTLSKAALLDRVYFPVCIATLATFRYHVQETSFGFLDYLRDGALTLPTQQWLQFGRLPLLDLVPNRGLSDVFLQSLYSVLNGYQGMDMLIWIEWLPEVVGLLLIYVFLAVITSPLLALLSTALLPVGALLVGPSVLVLLPAVILVGVVRQPTFRRFLLLWSVAVGLVVWRPEVGLATLVALLAVVSAFLLTEYREAVTPALGSLCLVLGFVPLMIITAEIFWTGDTYQALQAMLGWFADPPIVASTGGAPLAPPRGVTVFQSLVLPAVALLGVLYFGLQKLVGSGPFPDRAYAVLFGAIASLLLTMQSSRWSGGEEPFDPFLFFVVLAVIPFYVMGRRFQPRMLGHSGWFLAVTLLTLVVGGAVGGHLSDTFDSYHLAPRVPVFRFHKWSEGERRVHYDMGSPAELVNYLQREVQGSERTFFDFTNAPLLYVLAEKRFPPAIIPDFRLMSEEVQERVLTDLETLRQQKLIPVAVLESSADGSGPQKGVPSAAASYRIAEYLYRHYIPYARLGDFEVWRDRGLWKRRVPQAPAEPLLPDQIAQHFSLGTLPHLWALHDPWDAAVKTVIIASLVEEPINLRAAEVLPLKLGIEVDRAGGNYLHIKARALPPTTEPRGEEKSGMTVAYGEPIQSSFTFDLAPWSLEPRADDEAMELKLLADPVHHHMRRLREYPGRLVYWARREDPYVTGFADLSHEPVALPEGELVVRFAYRSTVAGTAQFFFASSSRSFSERQSVKVFMPVAELDGPARTLSVPVIGPGPSDPLVGLRVDPPRGAHFEIVGVELIRRHRRLDDYLIRLSTQWQWVSTDVDRLVLRTDVPVLVDSVLLRGGD